MSTVELAPARRFARLGTELLAPWVWVLGLPLCVAWEVTGHRWSAALLWGLVVGVTGSVVPMAVIVHGARKGRWDSHHVTNRSGRLVPFAACIGSLSAGFLILVLGGAPAEMLALAGAMLACLVACLVVTFGFSFKISMHAAVAAGAVVILAVVYSAWALLLGLLVAWVCWSRVELQDHTRSQVAAGVILGVVLGGLGYLVLS